MRTKSIILLLIALGFGLVASIGMSQLAGKGGETAVPTAPVYVTTTSVSQGDPLTEENMKLEQWPADKIPEGAISTPEALENMVTIMPLFAGEPILTAKVVDRANQISAADRIPPGHRVMSVKVNMDTSVSNLIQPGDHVDILSLKKDVGKAETILSNIEVFAINDVTRRIVDDETATLQAKTVSVLVKPDQATKLAYSADSGGGKLRLSLRSKDDNDQVDEESSSESTLEPFVALTQELPEQPSGPENAWRMQIVSGDGKIQNYTWDDANSDRLPKEVSDGTAPSFGGTAGGSDDAKADDLPPFQTDDGEESYGETLESVEQPQLESVFNF